MSNDAISPDAVEPDKDDAPQATDHAADLDDVPAAAGGQDTTDPAQGEGDHESH